MFENMTENGINLQQKKIVLNMILSQKNTLRFLY